MMNVRETAPLTTQMTAEERARLVVALDHDIRQPQHSIEMGLRTLRLVLADLKARRFDAATFDSLLQKMTVEVASVQAAIRQIIDAQRDLLDSMQLEFDERKPQPRTIWADDLIERTRKSNQALAGKIELRSVRSRLTFFSDERWAERILNNLVANAIRHSGATKVMVGARRHKGDIVFEVRDNGRGMTAERYEEVSESQKPFSTCTDARTLVRSGLGLYIVRLFTERLGGSLHYSSKPGEGTLFRVRLPGPLGTTEPAHRVSSIEAVKAARNKLVVVLDDDLTVLRTAERLFEALGIEVYADHDPLRWLGVVTDLKRAPDLVLLDFHLGQQDCSLLLEILRRKWGDQHTKVLVWTGASRSPGLTRIAAVVPVILKPLTDFKFDFILEVLGGLRELPSAGFLSVANER